MTMPLMPDKIISYFFFSFSDNQIKYFVVLFSNIRYYCFFTIIFVIETSAKVSIYFQWTVSSLGFERTA